MLGLWALFYLRSANEAVIRGPASPIDVAGRTDQFKQPTCYAYVL